TPTRRLPWRGACRSGPEVTATNAARNFADWNIAGEAGVVEATIPPVPRCKTGLSRSVVCAARPTPSSTVSSERTGIWLAAQSARDGGNHHSVLVVDATVNTGRDVDRRWRRRSSVIPGGGAPSARAKATQPGSLRGACVAVRKSDRKVGSTFNA